MGFYREYLTSQRLHMDALEYGRGGELSEAGPDPFYSLLMAAMQVADTDNLELLRAAFPEVLAELRARYNAPGGLLPGEGVL